MQSFAIGEEVGMPAFGTDPVQWFAWARDRIDAGDLESVWGAPPSEGEGREGHRWRLVRTERGVEIRPELGTPFLRQNHNPMIGAIQLDTQVVVELCSIEGRWLGRFGLDELDIAELGRAMLNEHRLPHDNIRLLFGRLAT